ncbi:MAG: hypothetical protein KBD15_00835, partial [Candidatus Magasanikbacteria bacterium]|nr:hypothetical protein [Candidatus Magasanikbacteria bacterium]
VVAQTLQDQINAQIGAGARAAEIGSAVPPQLIIAELIKTMLTLVGTIFMILILYGGYLLLTDRGEGEKWEKGIKTIRTSIVGVLIVLGAYSITLFIGRALMQNVYGKEYQNRNIRINCSAIRVIQGDGCESVRVIN